METDAPFSLMHAARLCKAWPGVAVGSGSVQAIAELECSETGHRATWLTQCSKLGGGQSTHFMLDGKTGPSGLFARNGKAMAFSSLPADSAHACQNRKEAGGDPIAFMKLELKGTPEAISDSGDRATVKAKRQLAMQHWQGRRQASLPS